jgi:hypothetical protein
MAVQAERYTTLLKAALAFSEDGKRFGAEWMGIMFIVCILVCNADV